MEDVYTKTRQSPQSATTISGLAGDDHRLPQLTPAWYADGKNASNGDNDDVNISWWLLTTLVPLLAAVFGPIASVFNICALIVDWRTTVLATSTEAEGSYIKDPEWLIAVNAVSLAVALVANLALLLQMVGRLPDKSGSPLTIGGWYIASMLLLGIIVATPSHLPLPTTSVATYSQSYYYAIFACALYFVLSTALLVTALALHYNNTALSHALRLTFNQRLLMLQGMTFFAYLMGMAALYSRIEHWHYLDALYYMNVTVFTIGLGDFSPKTHLGRSLFLPIATGGILLVGLMIVSMRTLILEAGSYNISTGLVEVIRKKEVSRGLLQSQQIRRVNNNDQDSAETAKDVVSEIERHRREFELMRNIQSKAAHHNQYLVLSFSIIAFFAVWMIGACIFWRVEQATGGEGWSFFEALYFTYTCLLTVGYGDFYPQTNSGKPAFVFWSLVALPILTMLIGAVSDSISTIMASAVKWWSSHVAPHGLDYMKSKSLEEQEGGIQVELGSGGGQPHATPNSKKATHKGPLKRYDDPRLAKVMEAMTKGAHLNLKKDKPTVEINEELEALLSAYRLHIILGEMHEILQHHDSDTPRKYSFEEWMWFLLLLMDEDAELEQVLSGNFGGNSIINAEPNTWSWLGHESPLIRARDEPKWILHRLLEIAHKKSRSRGDRMMEQWYDSRKKDETLDQDGG